jgi:hypothetical protein
MEQFRTILANPKKGMQCEKSVAELSQAQAKLGLANLAVTIDGYLL